MAGHPHNPSLDLPREGIRMVVMRHVYPMIRDKFELKQILFRGVSFPIINNGVIFFKKMLTTSCNIESVYQSISYLSISWDKGK